MDTIIVDDEQKAIDLLEFHLTNYFDHYKLIANYTNAQEALEGILTLKPDVVFLDINMPSGSGLELLRKINHLNCKIVFLTAHSEYALDAIKNNAFDYLLKPINVDELNRVDIKLRNWKNSQVAILSKKIKIQISNQVFLFEPNDIIFARSEGNYTTIYSTTQDPIILSKNLKKIHESYFSEMPFFRSHQSYIINLNHVTHFSNYDITLTNNHKAHLASNKYKELSELI